MATTIPNSPKLEDHPGLEHDCATSHEEPMTAAGSKVADANGRGAELTVENNPGLERDETQEGAPRERQWEQARGRRRLATGVTLFRDTVTVLRRSVTGAKRGGLTTTAQALAYSLFLAIPSGFLVVLGVFSLMASPEDANNLIHRADGAVPAEAVTLLSDSLQRSTESPSSGLLMTIVGLGLAVWATTSAATTLMQGISRTFDAHDERTFVRKRLTALAIVISLVAAAALVSGLLVFGPYLQRWVGNAVGQPTVTAWAWWTLQWPILVTGLLFAFAVLLYLGPDIEQRSWKLITPGAVTAMILWLVASGGFAIYAARFGSYNKAWGTLSAVVVMLVWLWLTSASLLFGAEVNAQTRKLVAEEASAATGAATGAAAASAATQWNPLHAPEIGLPARTPPPTIAAAPLRSISARASRALQKSTRSLAQGRHGLRRRREAQRRNP
jgi:membrane protein